MFNKTLLVSAIVLVALALGACSPTIMAEPAAPVRTLNVNGTGQVFLSPDIAYIYIGVHSEEATAAEAVAANNGETQKVIEALKEAGVDAAIWPGWPANRHALRGRQLGLRHRSRTR